MGLPLPVKRLFALFAVGLMLAAVGIWKAHRAMRPMLSEIDSYIQGKSLMEGK